MNQTDICIIYATTQDRIFSSRLSDTLEESLINISISIHVFDLVTESISKDLIKDSSIIVCLLSPAFLFFFTEQTSINSDLSYILKQKIVFPIIIRKCSPEKSVFRNHQFYPSLDQPLDFYPSIDIGIKEVSATLSTFIHRITSLQQSPKDIRIPEKILDHGISTIVDFIEELESGGKDLFEAKLIILGEPGAGKTTLARKIINGDFELSRLEKPTEGIEISYYRFEISDQRYFRTNIWDFGGQEIYYSTHQFFLTQSSLYLLVTDNRTENTNFNYWLEVISSLSASSPVIIVQNEKFGIKKIIEKARLVKDFSNLEEICQIDLLNNSGLAELRTKIEYFMQSLPHVGSVMPSSWTHIRENLEAIGKQKDFISDAEYYALCTKEGLKSKEDAKFLSQYLHDIGVFLHFGRNPTLKHFIFLNPQWITSAVYSVLDNPEIKSHRGIVRVSLLNQIWAKSSHAQMKDELLELMSKFELLYPVDRGSKVIIPQLLPSSQDTDDYEYQNSLVVQYQYSFLPKGIITRFIVRVHKLIEDGLVWQDGVILKKYNTKAKITQDYKNRRIIMQLVGKRKDYLLAKILDEFDAVNQDYPGLEINKLIPCNCVECNRKTTATVHFYNFRQIEKLLFEKDKNRVICMQSGEIVFISSLLGEVFGKDSSYNAGSKTIALSFATEDQAYKESFMKHLATATRKYNIIIRDMTFGTPPGQDRLQYLNESLNLANVVIAFISSSYLTEKSNSIDQIFSEQKLRQLTIIPILIKSCDFTNSPFSSIQPLPRDLVAISNAKNQDPIWTDIVKELIKVL